MDRKQSSTTSVKTAASLHPSLPPFLPARRRRKTFFPPSVTLTRALSDSAGVLVDASCADTARQKAGPEESKRRRDITPQFCCFFSRARRLKDGGRGALTLAPQMVPRYEATMDGIPDERLDAGGSRCRRD